MNKLTVVTVTYNSAAQLKRYAESLREALSGITSEMWVVDNASQDKTPLELKKLSYLKTILNSKNLGFGKANNLVLRRANSEYSLILNPDTVTPKQTIKNLLKFMDKNQDIGLVTCRVETADGKLDRACRRGFPTPWRSITRILFIDRLLPKTRLFGGYNMTYLPEDKINDIDSAVGAFMLVRGKALKEVGLFDEKFFMYGEDIDLCYRLKAKGWRIVYNPSVKILHYKGVSTGIKDHSAKMSRASNEHRAKMVRHFHEAMTIFYDKHYQQVYPSWLNKLVMTGISFKMYAALTRLKLRGY